MSGSSTLAVTRSLLRFKVLEIAMMLLTEIRSSDWDSWRSGLASPWRSTALTAYPVASRRRKAYAKSSAQSNENA
jgi:hypothetical protein